MVDKTAVSETITTERRLKPAGPCTQNRQKGSTIIEVSSTTFGHLLEGSVSITGVCDRIAPQLNVQTI